MIFAIEEINNSTELLPGIKLGYQIYDSCASVTVAVHVAFQLSGGLDPVFYTGNNCSQSGKVMAIVGETESTASISMSRVIGPFNIPQVSYFATCACLSDKQQYPTFFRTIPSDQFQADALAKLVKHFGWTWIGAIRTDSDYGNNGMASFLNAAHKEGICVEYSESFNMYHPRSRIQRVANIIRRSTAIVIVAFTSPGDFRILLEELSLKPFPPRQWIGTAATDKNACDGTEDLETIQSPYTDTSQLRITNMVYKAVYAIAHAIHNAVCQETHSITQCDKLSSIESKQVLTQLKKVNFSQNGYHVSFDANGDPVATYELVNWQKTEDGSLELVAVGHYDASLPVGQELRIKRNLTWVKGGTQLNSSSQNILTKAISGCGEGRMFNKNSFRPGILTPGKEKPSVPSKTEWKWGEGEKPSDYNIPSRLLGQRLIGCEFHTVRAFKKMDRHRVFSIPKDLSTIHLTFDRQHQPVNGGPGMSKALATTR
ncbi:Extracellular calcium-sensing receptor [Liparis tanakae]|uniref:Extracellular calcium-sensing receptor n=1 Tax=Liparis tanakae TaxID=230148 RepID=A0A4Z2HJI0_9TELE|nr:Extracellular calcium-sensing receptor [Liparis tanakae]